MNKVVKKNIAAAVIFIAAIVFVVEKRSNKTSDS